MPSICRPEHTNAASYESPIMIRWLKRKSNKKNYRPRHCTYTYSVESCVDCGFFLRGRKNTFNFAQNNSFKLPAMQHFYGQFRRELIKSTKQKMKFDIFFAPWSVINFNRGRLPARTANRHLHNFFFSSNVI